MSISRHHRTLSRDSNIATRQRSPSPPSQIHHPSLLPLPTRALVESAAGGAHYSGVRVDGESLLKRRRSSHDHPSSHLEVKADHQQIIDDLKELYCCRPTLEIFERSWNKDAVFEDPLSKCEGFREYSAQWFALPKICSKSETTAYRVMSSTHSPNRLVFSQTQDYTLRFFNRKKSIKSIVVVDLDENDKIIRLADQWDGKDLPTWFGATLLRTMNAKVTPWFVKVPKPM